ncbi:TonB-dependent receptor [uncultured Phascolarctobacterium sp.]|uniref:TonB-dependent receptor n=1 Tax=uncultured Phascolarctobacterium sp. TaxID=512296 RepID=UPI0025D91E89|nr:TonB-dependent receptor [uncultured Phascolarctobacterium sp.]
MLKKSLTKSALMVALLTNSVIWGGTAVYAEESLQQFNLDQMVVTATRTMKELQEVPSSVSVVTAQDIEERSINSVPEALQTLPGVYMNQAAQGGIQIRGFSSSDILVLLDGLPMNTTYNNGMEWEMVPVENIARIEVVRGAGSSLYGGRAVGAVVNIITKDNPEKKGANVNAVVSYGSNNTWKKALYTDARVNKKLSFGVGYENRKSDGYKGYYYTGSPTSGSATITPDNELPQLSNGKYILGGRGEKVWENENISANVKYDFDADKSLKYTFIHTESEYRYNNPWTTIYKDGKPIFNGSIDVGGGKIVKPGISSYLGYDGQKESNLHTLAYNDNKNKFSASFGYLDMKSNGFSSPSSPTSVDWTGAGTDSFYPGKTYNFDVQKAWEKVGKHSILVGGSFKQESFDQLRKYLSNWRDHDSVITGQGNNGVYENHGGKARNIALFVQDEYQISDPLTMYLGVRYDHFTKMDGKSRYYNKNTGALTRSLDYDEVSYNEISPKVAFDYKADDNTNYYVSYGHSFNPPPLYQVYRDGGGDRGDVVANPDLDPETSNTFEIGMKKKLSQRTNLGVSLYQVKTEDKILYTTHYKPGTTTAEYKKYENYGTEKRRGVEFTVDHRFDDNWGTYLNYAWQQGKVKQNAVAGTNLKDANSADYGIPKHLLHAGLNYNKDKFNAVLDCQYVSARQAPDDVTGEYGAEDAYFIVNTAFNYKIAKGTVLQFGINNLFDKEFYASEATSGRTYNVSLRYSF